MFDEWHRERFIRKTLRRLSQQRVVGIRQPDNILEGEGLRIEKAVSEGEGDKVVAALRTCSLRGWVEVYTDAVPLLGVAPVYKLTSAGWNVIHRSHEWVVATFVIVAITLIATILSIFIVTFLIK